MDAIDIFQHIEQMTPFVASRDWNQLEATYRAIAAELAGSARVAQIAALDFDSYAAELVADYSRALGRARECGARALYFQYDMDNDWAGDFVLCQHYRRQSEGDDDWASDPVEVIQGPLFEKAASLYLENDFDENPLARGTTLYLIARTVAAFGGCFDQVGSGDLAVCIGYHDQHPLVRLCEGV